MKKVFLLLLLGTSLLSYSEEISNSTAVDAFYQGHANNCASVALIKASMLKYGYKKVVKYTKTGSNYSITLKDGTLLNISDAEIGEAASYAKFGQKALLQADDQNQVMFYAHLYYACIAKFIVKNGYYGCFKEGRYKHYPPRATYKKALKFISNTSFCTDKCYVLLGLSIVGGINDFTDPSQLNQDGTILYSGEHTVVVDAGKLDCHGEWLPVTVSQVCGNIFTWFIVLN